ncbi:LPXTG cell wall anchor domain-containing protein [Listeria grandensis]|uniref:SpaA isopeptide-forming pilin-related protein n=1 Tax=Listeria grandensis TaxID=1494963 RepID=UPI001624D0F0|nr:SpaA isopeptide-forming pilin-related protein [Listeria grandensis]MBC1475369.1 LPXTG cell wall anchor domain-containing protein [Listeria grandensis]
MKRLISLMTVLVLFGSMLLPGVVGQASVDQGNFDIALKAYEDPIISNGQVNLKVTLSADANTIADENGLVKVTIPREIFSSGDLSNIHSDAFIFDHMENPAKDDPDSIAVFVKPDSSYNEGAAWSASFQLAFQAPLLRPGTEIKPEQTFNVAYNGKSDSQTLRVKVEEGGNPAPFEKWWKSAVDSNGIGILEEDDSKYNIFHLAVNADRSFELGDVTITDQIPDGLSVEQDPVETPNIEATDATTVKGIRIVEVAADGSRKYVTSQYHDAIFFDETTQRLEVNFKNLTKTDSFLIEYRVNMETNKEVYKNTATMTSTDVGEVSDSVLVRPDSNTNFNKALTKSVNKEFLIGDDTTLAYTLTLRSIIGTIKAGQVFTDTLDSRLKYSKMISGMELFDVRQEGQTLTFTAKKDMELGTKGEVVFEVDASGVAVGDTVSNKSEIELDNEQYDSNTVATKRVSNAILIQKVDQDDANKLLAGATFQLLNKDGEVVREGVTDASGQLIFKDVVPGAYEAVETAAPEGYILDKTPIPVVVEADSEDTISLVVKNKRNNTGVIQVEKRDAESKEKLANAKFTLTSENGVQSGTTDATGNLRFEHLTPGEYTLEEVEAPEGYVIDNAKRVIQIVSGEEKTITVTFENSRMKGSVMLTKKDSKTKEALEGVEFQLLDKQGHVVEDHLVTDEKGQILVGDLDWGEYMFKEVKAQEGYRIDENELAFEVNQENVSQMIELTKYNERIEPNIPEEPITPLEPSVPEEPSKPEKPSIPKEPNTPGETNTSEKPSKQPALPTTGDSGMQWFMMIGIILSTFGMRAYLQTRK